MEIPALTSNNTYLSVQKPLGTLMVAMRLSSPNTLLRLITLGSFGLSYLANSGNPETARLQRTLAMWSPELVRSEA